MPDAAKRSLVGWTDCLLWICCGNIEKLPEGTLCIISLGLLCQNSQRLTALRVSMVLNLLLHKRIATSTELNNRFSLLDDIARFSIEHGGERKFR